MSLIRIIFQSNCFFLLFFSVRSIPPANPIKCYSSNNKNCTITNTYGVFPDRSICQAGSVAYPSTENELISIVASATKNKLKMKVATRYSHSIPKLVCPDGQDGLLISTKNLNRVLKIDVEAMTMTVESGLTLRDFINEAANAGLALPYTPYWWGVTIGGILGTGAHGSTLWGKGSSVHDYVVGLKVVSPASLEDGYVKVRSLNDGDEELNALKISLGVLGVISQITLNLEPIFKRSITFLTKNDSDLGDQIASFGKQHEFGDITWYPDQHKAVYRVDDRVFSNTTGNGLFDSISLRLISSQQLQVIRTKEERQELLEDADGKCTEAKKVNAMQINAAFGFTNNGHIFKGYPIIGYQSRLQSSGGCLDNNEATLKNIKTCRWDPRVKGHQFYHHTAFSITLSKAKSFIEDVKKLVELEPKSMCGIELYNGILMRYVKASSAYLGKEEDAIELDLLYYRSRDPMIPRLYEDIFEEVEQLAIFKYGALPHWGKNRNIAFDGVFRKYKRAKEFLKVKYAYDPFGLFSSEWTDQILGLKDGLNIFKESCALEGLCICTKDFHCAPSKGYFCRHGKVYKEARVCTRLDT